MAVFSAGSAISAFHKVLRRNPQNDDKPMPELNDFYQRGEEWICKQCERELEPKNMAVHPDGKGKMPPPARYTDKTRRFVTCPRGGITEAVEKS
jgi:hypothetical protein